MQKTKRILSFFLVFCMLMTYIPNTMVYASEEKASEENVSENNASEQKAFAENLSAENISAENASEEKASEENASAEDLSAENTSEGGSFSSGSGTEDDPYIIADADDFKKLAEDVNGGTSYEGYYFKVSDDVTDPIELSSSEGFAPIGKTDYPFEGTFDGNGKTVNLNLDLSSNGEVGLFGNCGSESVIKNVTTTGSVTGQFIVGGIVGQTVGDIINCHNQAAVTGGDAYVGGIVGHASNTYGSNYVINCSNSGAVSGGNCVGGIIGNMDTAYVINCLNTGSVTGKKYTGGIAGSAQRYKITNCVNNGAVKKAEGSVYAVGGIAGELSSSVSPENCYYNSTINTGIYDAGYDNSGNLITTEDCGKSGTDIVSDTVLDKLNIYARDNTEANTSLLYWKADGDVISLTSEAPAFPYTITNNSADYITVDSCARNGATVTITVSVPDYMSVTEVTVKDANNADVAITQTATGYTFTMPDSDVTVSATADIKLTQENGVYQISSADEMKILSAAVNNGYATTNKSFLLTSNVSLSSAGGFLPIGTDSNRFRGTFDGNGKTVNLDLAFSGFDCMRGHVGLFGCCGQNSVIKNVTTTGSVNGMDYVGGIAGEMAGSIINCHNEAAVTGKSSAVGGIVGYPSYVINCSNSGAVTGSSEYVGGIAGHMSTAHVINCLNTGSVTGKEGTGGIAGFVSSSEITNCVNNAAVNKTAESDKPVGGIAGQLGSSVSLTNCYYNSTINTDIYDAGYDNDNVVIKTKDCAVSGDNIVSDTVLDVLNIYADKNPAANTALLYWKADGGVISLTSTRPDVPYAITNKSAAYITVDSCARSGATVTITVNASYMSVTEVTVKDADNTEVAITQTATGYTFTMPDSDVTVSATADIKLTKENGVYQISSADEMKILSDAVNNGYDTTNKSFQLTSDVSLSTEGGFAPIGVLRKLFKGTFDGGNHTVTLDLALSNTDYVGLFGWCGEECIIKNVTTTGSVTGQNQVGGIVGYSAGKIINCHNRADVTAASNTGGIAGISVSNRVINCSNSGAIIGSSNTGGITGNLNASPQVINCLNTGSVTGKGSTGGIAGYAFSGKIINCVNNAAVNKAAESDKPVGGIAGRLKSIVSLTNCYYNQTKNEGIFDAGYDDSENVLTTTDCAVSGNDIVSDTVLDVLNIYADKNPAENTAFLYWKADGDVISLTSTRPDLPYTITNNSDYLTVATSAKSGASVEVTVGEIPSYLRIAKITVNGEELSKNAEGKYVFTMPQKDVTVDAKMELALTKLEDGSYRISTADELAIFAKAVNSGEYSSAKAALTADITAKTAEGFESIGTYEHPYEGAFYGNGHTLTLQLTEGVAYNGTTATGLFGVVTRADIYDLILKGSVDGGDKTDSYTGALIGVASNVITDVYNVYSEVSVSGSGYVGGIGNIYARLWNVVNNGTVTQKNTADDKKAVGAIMGTGIRDYTNVYYNSEKNSGMYDCGYDANKNIVASDADSVKAKTTMELFTDEVMDALNLYAQDNGNLMFWDISADTQTVKLVDTCPAKVYEISPANAMSGKCITVPEYSRAGETVTVTTNVGEGYTDLIKEITGIKVTDSEGNVIEVTNKGEDTYEFVMPEKDVSIQAIFEYDITTDSDGVYCIENAKDLMIFSSIVEGGQPDANAKVTAESINISDLSEVDFTSDGLIGQNKAYKGEFDGNGVPITWYGAVFGKTDGAVIKNMNISTAVSCDNPNPMAGVVKNAKNTRIDNCYVMIEVDAYYAAGIVGEATDSVITNCSVTASGGAGCFGGIVNTADNTVIANCVLNESVFGASVYGGIVFEAYGDTKIYNCVNQDSFTAGDVDCAGAIVGNAEMSGLTLENNFYYKTNGCYDVYFDFEKDADINAMTDENSAVAEDDVKALYIPAKLNEYIEENPGLIEGTTLHKWSNIYNAGTDSNAACFVDDTHPEIYSIKQSDIIVPTLVSGNSVYGAAVGAEVTVSGVADGANVTVTDENGNKVASTLNGDTYVFTMPACDVTVSVTMDSGIKETTEIDGKKYVVVRNADDFIKAVASIAAGNNILNVYIAEDITLTAGDLANYPAYAETTPAYNGTFDGAGHTVTFNGAAIAMLATIGEKGVVKNITVDGTISGGELPAAAFALVNMGTIFNCINQAEVSGQQAAGIALSNGGMIFNCINKGDIDGSVSAAITYMNQGMVGMVANEGTINHPSENGNMIADGIRADAETSIDLSEVADKSKWKECAAQFNASLESIKAQMESGSYPAALQVLLKEALEWSVSETDAAAEMVFADEENVPYYMCTTPEGNKPYQAGSTVEVKFDTSTLEEGFVIGSVTVQAEYANEKFNATPVSGKENTFSFTMPRKTCKAVMNVEASGIEKDENGYYLVGTLDDLTKVKKMMEYGNDNINIKLTADIEGYEGTPIGGAYGYDGIFDGNGHSITLAMLEESGSYRYYGFFGILQSSAVVKNLTIKGSIQANNSESVGAVAGKSYGTVTDCVNNATVTNNSGYAGGIVGSSEGEKNSPAKLSNCVNNGNVTGGDAGGIVCDIADYSVISNCENTGDVTATNEYEDAGGIAAQGNNVEINNCKNTGAVSGEYAGGVISYPCGNSVINNCINTGDVAATYYAGGIVGYGEDNMTVRNCFNSGKVTGGDVYAIACYDAYGSGSNGIILNSFYLQTEDVNAGLESSNLTNGKDASEAVTEAKVRSGYVAYHLRSGQMEGETVYWGQTLTGENADAYPVLGGKTVYRNETYTGCPGKPGDPTYSYSNKQEETVYAPHDYIKSQNGSYHECTICHEKATLYIKTAPTAADITYGQTLGASALSGGVVQRSENDATTVKGTFAWKEASAKPKVADSGKTEYVVVFTPTGADADKFDAVETKLTLTVNKAKNAPGMPGSTMSVPYTTTKVSEITTLPTGWGWQDADKTKALEDGKAVTATAIYNGADKGNYETESVEISITRLAGDTPQTPEPGTGTDTPQTPEPGTGTDTPQTPKKGDVVADDKGIGYYKVTDVTKKEVAYQTPANKKATTVSIPATVTIGGITYKVTAIADKAFANNKKIKKVTIGSNITTIGKQAFYKCTKLKTVKIGKNVTTISDKAFYKCTALTKITIPSKVSTIGKQAFYGCKKLKTITIKTTKLTGKNVGSKAFKGIYAKATIKVPKSKLTSYKKLLKAKGVSSNAKIKK